MYINTLLQQDLCYKQRFPSSSLTKVVDNEVRGMCFDHSGRVPVMHARFVFQNFRSKECQKNEKHCKEVGLEHKGCSERFR